MDVSDAGIDFASGIVGQHGVDQSLIQAQLSAVAGDLEHVVNGRVNIAAVYLGCAFRECLYQFRLLFGGLHHHRFKVCLGCGQMQLIRCLDVRHFLEDRHEFRQVEESCESGSCPVAGTFRGKLNGRGCFTEGACPGVEVGHVAALECAVLQVTLHGVQLGHAVGNWSAGGKDDAPAASQFIHVATLHEHVRGLLCFRSGQASHVAHLRVEEQVLKPMRLVHIQAIHTQLLKGDNIILLALSLQLFQAQLQLLLGPHQLLDGKLLTMAALQFVDARYHFVDLLLNETFLPCLRHRDALKLRVTDDDRIVITSGDTAAELLTVVTLKVLLCSHQNPGRRIEPQELRGPLLRQVVGNHKHGFLTKPQPFGFHTGSDHFKRLARAHFMGKQRIAAVQDVRDSVSLVFSQGDLRVDAHKGDVGAIKLTGTGGIETLVVLLYQRMAAVRITPHPIPESILDGLLLLLGKGRLLLVQYTLFLAFLIQHNVIDAGVTQVQGVLQNAVGVGSVRAEGGVGCNIGTGDSGLAGDVPFGGVGREMHLNLPLQVVRGAEGFVHELLDVVLVYPCCTQTDVDLRCVQILGLSRYQGFHIGNEPGVMLCEPLSVTEFLPYIAGKVLVGRHILQGLACAHRLRQRKDHAGQFLGKLIFGLAGQLRHERKIHADTLSDGDGQGFHSSIDMLDNFLLLDGALGEHVRFPLELLLIIQNLQRTQEVVGRIV